VTVEEEGRKADAGKARWSLIPWGALAEAVEVLEHGARKYAPHNWRRVSGARGRYSDALLRHVAAWAAGEWCDRESGRPHLAHAVCCALYLIAFELEGLDP